MSKTAFAKGNQLFRENKLEEAIREYKKAIEANPLYFVYENLGLALEKKNRKREAKENYSKALELNRESIRAREFISKLHLHTLEEKIDSLLQDYMGSYSLGLYGESALEDVSKKCKGNSDSKILVEKIINFADDALSTVDSSVLDKTEVPPSGDKKDYFHPAPYWWPNPDTSDGMPYVYRDGERVPGTRMYEEESNKYDRTNIQMLFDDATTLALAWYFSKDERYIYKAYNKIKKWFIDEETAMNPNLNYAQVIQGKNNNQGKPVGIIETKDFYYFLDAVRLVRRSAYWTENDHEIFNDWCSEFLIWLESSKQGEKECRATNNHGIAYDLQVYSLSAYLGDTDRMKKVIVRAIERLPNHFDEEGYQHREMERTTTAHYTSFNVQLWLNLYYLVKNTTNIDIFDCGNNSSGNNISPLIKGVNWLLPYTSKEWPYKQIDEFDKERLSVIYNLLCKTRYSKILIACKAKPTKDCEAKKFPHDGIPPYWPINCLSVNNYSSLKNHVPIKYTKPDLRNRVVKHLWGGLSEEAVPALEEVLETSFYPRSSRTYAGWELSRWYAFIDDDKSSLRCINKIVDLDENEGLKKEVVLSKAFIELRSKKLSKARSILQNYKKEKGFDPDIELALSNAHSTEENRLKCLNNVFEKAGFYPVVKIDETKPLGIKNVTVDTNVGGFVNKESNKKVSIIIPVFNAEDKIETAIQSLINQTYRNIEILVVDDCSTDHTFEVIKEIARRDERVIPLQVKENGGAYKARNFGLEQISGDYITTHDSDDWSHPQKIETEVNYLENNKDVMGLAINWVRVKDNLYFTQNWRPADTLIHKSESSFMFRKKVLDTLGKWDEVRVGGDNEYIGRMKNFFGNESYKVINNEVPLAFGLDDENSLTRTKDTHVSTVYGGLRHIYREIWSRVHVENNFKLKKLPALMVNKNDAMKYHCIIKCDFSSPCSTDFISLLNKININKNINYGLMHVPSFEITPKKFVDEYFELLLLPNVFPIA